MSRYAQILLHFLHAVANDRDRVRTFLFGTRLSNITRQLRHRDPEVAFQMVVPRGAGLVRRHPHRRGARRVQPRLGAPRAGPGRGGAAGHRRAGPRRRRGARREHGAAAQILLAAGMAEPAVALGRASQPKSQGIRAMLPHVDEFRPVHNLASLRALVRNPVPPACRAAGWTDGGLPHEHVTTAEDVLSRRRRVARRRRAGGAGHGDRDLGQFAAPGRQPHGGDRVGQDGRLGQRRLHRGRGRRRRAADDARPARRNCWISASPTSAPGRSGLACGGKVKVFVEKLA